MLRASRGQTLIEFIIGLPIVLFALFAVIYLSRFGVVAERAELAVRYGAIAGFDTTTDAYSAANIYQNIGNLQNVPSPCPTPPLSVFSGASPFPGPTSGPYFQPDSDVQPPSSSCVAAPYSFGSAQFLATHYFATTTMNVSAAVDVPTYLQALLGKVGSVSTTATFAHSAYPSMILYCSTEVYDRVWGAITAESTTDTPPPGPTNNGTCQ